MGAFEYEDDGLKQIHTSNGRVRYDVNTNDYHYDYFLKDHLGNTRVVFTGDSNDDEPTVLQVNNYYPFGMRFNQGPEYQSQENQYLYNGKELQSDMGLDWYDYGARMYDPSLGRWHVIDNKAEKYYFTTPYTYALNNPILFIDPDGNEVWKTIKDNGDGTSTVTINFDIRVTNSGNFGTEDVKRWSGAIASHIESSFSGYSRESKTTYVAKVNMDLSGKENGNYYTMDFTSKVEGGSEAAVGRMDGEFGHTKVNNMQIEAPGSDNGPYYEQTEEGVGRTGAYEVGHTGNLRHPSDPDNELTGIDWFGNLMHQSDNNESGNELVGSQLDEFIKYVQEGKPKNRNKTKPLAREVKNQY